MRFALGSLISASVLFVAAGFGAVGAWALPVSAVALLASAVIAATVMEHRDVPVIPKRWSAEVTGELPVIAQALQRAD